MKRVWVWLHAVASVRGCIVVDQRCRGSKGKVKIEGYMRVSDEEAHHRVWLNIVGCTLMSLLIRYAHIPSYFRFSFTFPTSSIHHYAPLLQRDRAHARTTIALALLDQSHLFDGHMTYDSHVFTSIISVSNMPPPAVRPITRSGTFYSFAICSHSCLPLVFNLPVFTFC